MAADMVVRLASLKLHINLKLSDKNKRVLVAVRHQGILYISEP